MIFTTPHSLQVSIFRPPFFFTGNFIQVVKQWNIIAIVVLERRLEKNVIVLQYFNSIAFSVFIEYKNFKKKSH